MAAEEVFERLLAAHPLVHVVRPRLRLVMESDDPELERKFGDARLTQLSSLLPGLPARALELLADVSDAVAETSSAGSEAAGAGAEPFGTVAARGRRQLAGAEATVALSRVLEGLQVGLLAGMAASVGRELLGREHGLADPATLSRTKRARWRARTKSVVAQEFAGVAGFGIQDCHDRVGFALAPSAACAPARTALHEGRADWWQVWQWWKRCRRLDPDSATDVATTCFPPAEEEQRVLQSRRAFMEVLDREATRAVGQDPVAARAARAAAVERRRLRATVDPDGTGCLSLTGRTSTVVAAVDRIDAIARRARAGGDTRTLDQLRSDAALALLTTGNLAAAGTEQLTASSAETTFPGTRGPRSLDTDTDTEASVDEAAGHPPTDADRINPASGGGWDQATLDRLSSVLAGHAPATVEVVIPHDVLTGANPDGVGLLTGHGHLTGEHAREIALSPGSAFYRLVTDPASGTLVDRSVDRYTPDAEMRAIITAADRYCRGPGCTVPGRLSELDHVNPYPHGPTALSNLVALHTGHHGPKTNRWWTAMLDPATRVLTWTSFYDRIYTTAPFDYAVLARATAGLADRSGTAGTHVADLQDQLVYAALAHREPGSSLAEPEDSYDPGSDLWARRGPSPLVGTPDAPVLLTHAGPDGGSRPGAPPGQPTPEQIVNSVADDGEGGDSRDGGDGGAGCAGRDADDPPPPF